MKRNISTPKNESNYTVAHIMQQVSNLVYCIMISL